MARFAPLLALLLVVSLAAPVLGRSATEAYGDALDMMSGSRAATAAADAQAASDAEKQARMSYVEQQLNLAKAELRQLEAAYRTALRKLKGDAHECEREALLGIYAAERTRLKSRIREYRQIRGDRRGFFTKAWHSIGPAGRRIARALGDGAVAAVTSGGLGGGVARRLLLSAGRDELRGAAVRAVVRRAQGRSATAVAAVGTLCGGDETDPDELDDDELDDELPAIPAGTYVGEIPMDLSADALVSGKVAEANTLEIEVTEAGVISGELEHRLRGVFDGCPGYLQESVAFIEPGQRVGPELPQSFVTTVSFRIMVPVIGVDIDTVDSVCGDVAEPFIDGTEVVDLVIDATDEGVLQADMGDGLRAALQWVP